ncbi:MAG: DNA-3-methyladenine glycosylase [Selenomonadaceae bacterium]|nr:DNA-3-methyladenine glycosylase [Selenomonadaceae bacterium]
MMKLERKFYQRSALIVAKELLGKKIICRTDEGTTGGIIIETEAYMGAIDPAAHSYKNRRTNRTEAMFSDGGHAYIYLIYGIYYCFNVVANVVDVPEAVLIRALKPIEGIEIMKRRRNNQLEKNLCSGPGKLTQALGIDKTFNNIDLCGEKIFIETTDFEFEIETTKRINIDYAGEAANYPYRFVAIQ